MKELGEAGKRLQGADPQLYIPYARLMLGQMKERMKMLNLQQLQWQKILAGGVLVFVSSVFGQDTIQINVPPTPVFKDNPHKLELETFEYETEYRDESEMYFFANNILYKVTKERIEQLHTFDFTLLAYRRDRYVVAGTKNLALSYIDESNSVHINFYKKNAYDSPINTYVIPGLNSVAFYAQGQGAYFRGDFYMLVTVNDSGVGVSYVYIFSEDGVFKNVVLPQENVGASYLQNLNTDSDRMYGDYGAVVYGEGNTLFSSKFCELDENLTIKSSLIVRNSGFSEPNLPLAVAYSFRNGLEANDEYRNVASAGNFKATVYLTKVFSVLVAGVGSASLLVLDSDNNIINSIGFEDNLSLNYSLSGIEFKTKTVTKYRNNNQGRQAIEKDVYIVKYDAVDIFYYKEI